MQNQQGLVWDAEEVAARLQKTIIRAFHEMVETMRKHHVPPRAGRHDSGGESRRGKPRWCAVFSLDRQVNDTHIRNFTGSDRLVLRWLAFALLFCLLPGLAAAQKQLEVAITVDDLPSHGDLPPAITRLEVAKNMIDTFKAKGVRMSTGFSTRKGWNGNRKIFPC